MKKYILALTIILSACQGRYTTVAKEVTPKTVSIEVPTIIEQTWLTFDGDKFNIHIETGVVKVQGSGVFISPQGHILTCAHLFEVGQSSDIIVIALNGVKVYGTLLYKDKAKDLALLKVKELGYFPHDSYGVLHAKLTNNILIVGEDVLAIGNPLGLSFTITHGIVSKVGRDLGDSYLYTQTDAPINPGNSGGPLFNMEGELIGINSLKIPSADGLAFAISPQTIREFLRLFEGLPNDN